MHKFGGLDNHKSFFPCLQTLYNLRKATTIHEKRKHLRITKTKVDAELFYNLFSITLLAIPQIYTYVQLVCLFTNNYSLKIRLIFGYHLKKVDGILGKSAESGSEISANIFYCFYNQQDACFNV